jgi:hypothetical protein
MFVAITTKHAEIQEHDNVLFFYSPPLLLATNYVDSSTASKHTPFYIMKNTDYHLSTNIAETMIKSITD